MFKKDVILYIGSFDPPHLGHLNAVVWALSTDCYKEVWVMPAYKNTFKKDMAPFNHRVEMCKLAFKDLKRVKIKTYETKAKGSGETYHLLSYLTNVFPSNSFSLLIGEDNYEDMKNWYKYEYFNCFVDEFIVADRSDISSTQIKNWLKTEEGKIHLKKYLPSRVWNYIITEYFELPYEIVGLNICMKRQKSP